MADYPGAYPGDHPGGSSEFVATLVFHQGITLVFHQVNDFDDSNNFQQIPIIHQVIHQGNRQVFRITLVITLGNH